MSRVVNSAETVLGFLLEWHPSTLLLILNKSLLAQAKKRGVEVTLAWSDVSLVNLDFCINAGLERGLVSAVAMYNQDLALLKHAHERGWHWAKLLKYAKNSLPETKALISWALEHGLRPRPQDVLKWILLRKGELLPGLMRPEVRNLPKWKLYTYLNIDEPDLHSYRHCFSAARTLDPEALVELFGPVPQLAEERSEHFTEAAVMLRSIGRLDLSAEQLLQLPGRGRDNEQALGLLTVAEVTSWPELRDALVNSMSRERAHDLLLRCFKRLPCVATMERLWLAAGEPEAIEAEWHNLGPCSEDFLFWAKDRGLAWNESLVCTLVRQDRMDLLSLVLESCPIPKEVERLREGIHLPNTVKLLMDDSRFAAFREWIALSTVIEANRLDWLQKLLTPARITHYDLLLAWRLDRFVVVDLLCGSVAEDGPRKLRGVEHLTWKILRKLTLRQLKQGLAHAKLRPLLRKAFAEAEEYRFGKSSALDKRLLLANVLTKVREQPFPLAWIGDRFERLELCVVEYGLPFALPTFFNLFSRGSLNLLDELLTYCDRLIEQNNSALINLWFFRFFSHLDIFPARDALMKLKRELVDDLAKLEDIEPFLQNWLDARRSSH